VRACEHDFADKFVAANMWYYHILVIK